MYIKSVKIDNYRNFDGFEIMLDKGLNVIIGSNNAGKSGFLNVIKILNELSRMSIYDFNMNNLKKFYNSKYKESSPSISFIYTINHQVNIEDYNDEIINRILPFFNIDKVKVCENEKIYDIDFSIKLEYVLDSKYDGEYKKAMKEIKCFDDYLNSFKLFECHYVWKIYNAINGDETSTSALNGLFIIDFIDAERNTNVIYELAKKELRKFLKLPENETKKIEANDEFASNIKRILKGKIDELDQLIEKEDIGLKKGNVSINQNINTNVSLEDGYIINITDLKGNYNLPLDHNGVGYNNLINIYLYLKLIEKDKNDFRILCLEEPEAHLHPAMQYKLFKYIRDKCENDSLNQQIIVTTHSTNVTSVTNIDNIIMFDYIRTEENEKCVCQRLVELFDSKDEDLLMKKHLIKFLDVTRSDLLFSDKIILVEGVAEKICFPFFMEKLGFSYEDEHISIVECGGKNFKPFLKLYLKNKIKKKILIVTDKDYSYYGEDGKLDITSYSSHKPGHITDLEKFVEGYDNVKIVSQTNGGITFEDELFINLQFKPLKYYLLYKSFPETLKQYLKINKLDFKNWKDNTSKITNIKSQRKIIKMVELYKEACEKEPDKKLKIEELFFAQLYYEYIKNEKGTNALEIISNNWVCKNVNVPKYIEEGIKWIMQKQ